MSVLDIAAMQAHHRDFVAKRNWGKYHNPKNISMALTKEASELMEIFQWLERDESFLISKSPELMEQVRDEVADVLAYLLRLADLLEIDLNEAFWKKMEKNAQKYPQESSQNALDHLGAISLDNLGESI